MFQLVLIFVSVMLFCFVITKTIHGYIETHPMYKAGDIFRYRMYNHEEWEHFSVYRVDQVGKQNYLVSVCHNIKDKDPRWLSYHEYDLSQNKENYIIPYSENRKLEIYKKSYEA